MGEYLPPKATAAEAVAWLEKNTGEAWSLARIVETGIWPWFRFDYSPEHAHMFGDRFEGYAAQMTFGCDKQRLLENASDQDFLVTMFYVPAGILSPNEELVRTTPIFLPMSALRFAREDIQRIASVLQRADDKTVERSKPDWHAKAWEIGVQWMLAQEKQTGTRPSVQAIAAHVEREFKRLDIRGARDDYYSAATIKREALTGINGRPANGKKQGNPPR